MALGVDRDGTRRALAETSGGLPAMRAGSPYFASMKRLGYTADELAAADGRVLDAMIAWGDDEAIARRIRAHLDAGADHVLLHPIPTPALDVTDQLDRLAALARTP
ncbi:MAG TPA: hypothetical protein VI076_14150 [Actinopolymorphaceae bacterium]